MKRIILCVILLITLATNVESQTSERWYWAYREADGAVLAYQASGNVRVLLEDVYAFKLHRLDDQTASVMIEMDGQFAVYILTPTQAMFVASLYTENDLEGINYEITGPPGVEAAKLIDPFILIWSYDEVPPLWNYRYMPLPLLLFNRETQQTEWLPMEVREAIRASGVLTNALHRDMRVSRDGRLLRYRVEHETDNPLQVRWSIYEYDVVTDENRTIYTRNETTEPQNISIDEGCTPDTYGELWYCFTTLGLYEGGVPVGTSQLISLDGYSRVIPIDFHLKEAIGGEWFFIESDGYNFGCGVGCEIRLFSVEGQLLATFRLTKDAVPENVVFNLWVSEVADSERLIVTDDAVGRTLYMLSADGGISFLGTIPCCPSTPPSPDGRWRILFDLRSYQDGGEPKTVVWDLLNQRIVWEHEGLDYGYGEYVDGGIYLSWRDYFSFHDYQGYQLDTALYSYLVDILPDGVFIYARPDEIGDRPAGIYRFTVPEGHKLLIEGATFIPYSSGPPRY